MSWWSSAQSIPQSTVIVVRFRVGERFGCRAVAGHAGALMEGLVGPASHRQFVTPADRPMSLRLAGGSGSEAVDLEAAGDADDAGLIFAGGEVAGLLGGAGAGPVGPVADEESGVEDLEQERGQGQVKILRGKSPP